MTEDEQRDMAERIYDLDSRIALAEANIKDWREERDQLSSALAEELGVGGACFIMHGRVVAYVSDGRRSIDRDAVDKASEHLPPDLQPQEVTTMRYPTVDAITKAAPVLTARGVSTNDLIKYAGRRYTVRYRDAE